MAAVRLDPEALNRLLRSPDGPVARDLLRRGHAVENRAKGLCPVKTGRLRASITTQLVSTTVGPAVIVGTNVEYGRYVHDGTGLYGPNHARIVRPGGGVMRWVSGGKPVFARSTQGMPGRPFLKDALVAAA